MKVGLNLTLITITAMLCITALEVYALSKGVNGVLLTAVIGALAGVPTWFVTKRVMAGKAGKND